VMTKHHSPYNPWLAMVMFLFWNLSRKPLQQLLANLAERHEVDVLMLAECSVDPVLILEALNTSNPQYHYAQSHGCEKIDIYTRFPAEFITPIYEENRLTIRRLQLPGLIDMLLAVHHFPSKVHSDDESQALECVTLSNTLREAEHRVGHSRTVLVSDFNMNPFEVAVVSANGLHAVMSKSIAEGRSRVVREREYPYFYNPMWSLLGDASPSSPGTYYYRTAEHKVYFWKMFDQVLVRPDLLNKFDSTALEIIDSDGTTSLLTPRGYPDSSVASDHLPILFGLDL
jgi:hypothetical protein